jgi:endoglucanase
LALLGVTAGALGAENFLFDGTGGSSSGGTPPSGSDTLVLHLAEDAWNGDAQFTVEVDGKQIAGPTAVTTAHSSGGFQDFTYTGDFGAGPHTVAIHFINDGWGGTAATDRNLYVGGIDFGGTHYAWTTASNDAANGASDANAAVMAVNGTVAFGNVSGGSELSTPPAPISSGTDSLVLHLAEDAWNGDAQFTLDVDGKQIAGPTAVTTPHGSGFEDFTFQGDFGAGPHAVAIHFINDAWGGSASTDRNLYVGGIEFNGQHYDGQTAQNDAHNGQPDTDPSAAEMLINGTVTFANVVGSQNASQLLV